MLWILSCGQNEKVERKENLNEWIKKNSFFHQLGAIVTLAIF